MIIFSCLLQADQAKAFDPVPCILGSNFCIFVVSTSRIMLKDYANGSSVKNVSSHV